MPKYYVQSGNLRIVVQANNSRGAALWAMHRAMSQVLPFLADEPDSAPVGGGERIALGESLDVSERGFDSLDARQYNTFDLSVEWNQLMIALDRLERDCMTTAV